MTEHDELVQRLLTELYDWWGKSPPPFWEITEAADEIERFRAAVKELSIALAVADPKPHTTQHESYSHDRR